MNLAAVAQSSPGAIAVNLATVTGVSCGGEKGRADRLCLRGDPAAYYFNGCISAFYAAFRDNRIVAAALKGMEAGVCALVVDVVIDMGRAVFKEKQPVLSCFAAPCPLYWYSFLQVECDRRHIGKCGGILCGRMDGEESGGMELLFNLFVNFLQVGLFSFGGGYATIPLIQQYIVDAQQWITFQELTDILTISQMTPGPIAVNTARRLWERVSRVSRGR